MSKPCCDLTPSTQCYTYHKQITEHRQYYTSCREKTAKGSKNSTSGILWQVAKWEVFFVTEAQRETAMRMQGLSTLHSTGSACSLLTSSDNCAVLHGCADSGAGDLELTHLSS